jgi:hypothetical protein
MGLISVLRNPVTPFGGSAHDGKRAHFITEHKKTCILPADKFNCMSIKYFFKKMAGNLTLINDQVILRRVIATMITKENYKVTHCQFKPLIRIVLCK